MKQERYLLRHRKGFIDNTMLAILAIATIIIFSLFVYKAYTNFRDKMSVQSCKSSVEAHNFIAAHTARDMFTDIKCPTTEITIKDNSKAKDIMAEDMHRCWYIWGQGQGQYFQGAGSFCQVCGIYQFGDKGQQISGFMEYLGTQSIKVKYPGDVQGTKYADYFAGVSTPKSAEMVNRGIDELSKVDYINTSQHYATIFVYASGKTYIQKALEGGGRSTLGTVGLFGVIGGTAAVGAGIFVVSNPVGWIVGGVAAAGVGVAAIWTALHVVEPESVQFVVFRPYDNETLDNLGCEKMYVNQMSNAGTG